MTAVISAPAISASRPATPLPSTCISSISSSRRPEALGPDRAWVMTAVHQQVARELDERGGAADERARVLARLDFGDHRGVDAPAPAGPARRRIARVRVRDAQPLARLEPGKLIGIQQVARRSRRD